MIGVGVGAPTVRSVTVCCEPMTGKQGKILQIQAAVVVQITRERGGTRSAYLSVPELPVYGRLLEEVPYLLKIW